MEQKEKKMTLYNSTSLLDEKENITEKERSKLVRDHDYGRIKSANAEVIDKPLYAIIEYDENGQIVYEDYSKLDAILQKVIADNIKDTHVRDSNTSQKKVAKTIQGNVLTKLRLSELETEYAINYLSERNILIRGIDSSLDNDFDGYQYISTYKSNTLPPALSSEENSNLFRRMKQIKLQLSKETSEIKKNDLQKELHKIRNQLIEGNMRLVASIVYNKVSAVNVEIEDLFQIAYECLIDFIDKYDVDKGYALSTGLYNYLMFHVWRNYSDIDIMKISANKRALIIKILKVKKVIEPILKREATAEEIAMELNIDVSAVIDALRIYQSLGVESLERLHEKDEPDEQFYDYALEDDIEDFEIHSESLVDDSMSKIFDGLLKEEVEEILKTLTEKESTVLKLRFGFFDNRTRTMQEVANIFGVPREIIRQIENKAIRKLRHPSRAKHVKDYYLKEDDRFNIFNSGHKR